MKYEEWNHVSLSTLCLWYFGIFWVTRPGTTSGVVKEYYVIKQLIISRGHFYYCVRMVLKPIDQLPVVF